MPDQARDLGVWQFFRGRPAFSKRGDDRLLNDWCMAACYSADTDGTVHLPFDLATGMLIPEVWQRWLAWDPVRRRMTEHNRAHLPETGWDDVLQRCELAYKVATELAPVRQ